MFALVAIGVVVVIFYAMKAESVNAPMSGSSQQQPPQNTALPYLGAAPFPSPQTSGGMSGASQQFQSMHDFQRSSNVAIGLRASLNPKTIRSSTGVLNPLPDTIDVGAKSLATQATMPITTFKY